MKDGIDWNAIVKDVETQVLELAKEILTEYASEASKDVHDFLTNAENSLERWSAMLVNGEIDRDEFQFLVKGQLDIAELHALKQAGLSEVMIDRFIKGVVTILTTAVTTAAKGLV